MVVDVTNGYSLDIVMLQKCLHHSDAAIAHSYESHRDSFAGSSPPIERRQEGRKREARLGEKLSTRGLLHEARFAGLSIRNRQFRYAIARAESVLRKLAKVQSANGSFNLQKVATRMGRGSPRYIESVSRKRSHGIILRFAPDLRVRSLSLTSF